MEQEGQVKKRYVLGEGYPYIYVRRGKKETIGLEEFGGIGNDLPVEIYPNTPLNLIENYIRCRLVLEVVGTKEGS